MRTMLIACNIVAAITLSACGKTENSDAHANTAQPTCPADRIVISDAWVRPARAGQPTTAAYFSICNGGQSTSLIAAAFDGAKAAELHQTAMSDDAIASMSKSGGIELPNNTIVEFKPGGRHIMLIGVTDAIDEDSDPLISLSFANGETVGIVFDVRAEQHDGDHEHH